MAVVRSMYCYQSPEVMVKVRWPSSSILFMALVVAIVVFLPPILPSILPPPPPVLLLVPVLIFSLLLVLAFSPISHNTPDYATLCRELGYIGNGTVW